MRRLENHPSPFVFQNIQVRINYVYMHACARARVCVTVRVFPPSPNQVTTYL